MKKAFMYCIFFCLIWVSFAGTAAAAEKNRFTSGKNGKTVTDDAGKSVTFSEPFKRIISLYGAHTENLFALGLDSEIVGVSKNDDYPEKVRMKKRFSYHDDPEKFLAADPDLILIRPMIARGYGPLVLQMQRSGIVVLSFQPASVREMFAYWRKLGILTDRKETAEQMVSIFKESVEFFSNLTADVKEKKKVYFEAIHAKMKTFTPGSMPLFVLAAAGGINIAGDARQVRETNIAFYGKERLLSKAAIIDVYLSQRGVMNRVTVDEIRNEPGYGIIQAVKKGNIFLVDETVVSRPTLRLLRGIYQVGHILYPERFDKRAESKADVTGLIQQDSGI